MISGHNANGSTEHAYVCAITDSCCILCTVSFIFDITAWCCISLFKLAFRNARSAAQRRTAHAMALTKQMQRIVTREIRPYILPLPYFDYDDPVLIAAFLSDEDWFRWHKHLASCYIPLRTVCNVVRSLHLSELMVANLLHLRRLLHACW